MFKSNTVDLIIKDSRNREAPAIRAAALAYVQYHLNADLTNKPILLDTVTGKITNDELERLQKIANDKLSYFLNMFSGAVWIPDLRAVVSKTDSQSMFSIDVVVTERILREIL